MTVERRTWTHFLCNSYREKSYTVIRLLHWNNLLSATAETKSTRRTWWQRRISLRLMSNFFLVLKAVPLFDFRPIAGKLYVALDNIVLTSETQVLRRGCRVSCSFDNDEPGGASEFCGWSNFREQGVGSFRFKNWLSLPQGQAQLADLVLNASATGSTGSFLYLSADDRSSSLMPTQEMKLVTNGDPEFPTFRRLSRPSTFTFWYYARGAGIRHLQLALRDPVGLVTPLWLQVGGTLDDVDPWQVVHVPFCTTALFAVSSAKFSSSWECNKEFNTLRTRGEPTFTGVGVGVGFSCHLKSS